MMTIFELDNIDRCCDSLQVRLFCGRPSDSVWAEYRKLCGVESHQRRLTRQQTMMLLARARLKNRKGITRLDVIAEANRMLRVGAQTLRSLEVLVGSQERIGREIPDVIQDLTGRSISFSTLYRMSDRIRCLPKFSRSKTYSPEQVRRFVRAAIA